MLLFLIMEVMYDISDFVVGILLLFVVVSNLMGDYVEIVNFNFVDFDVF